MDPSPDPGAGGPFGRLERAAARVVAVLAGAAGATVLAGLVVADALRGRTGPPSGAEQATTGCG